MDPSNEYLKNYLCKIEPMTLSMTHLLIQKEVSKSASTYVGKWQWVPNDSDKVHFKVVGSNPSTYTRYWDKN